MAKIDGEVSKTGLTRRDDDRSGCRPRGLRRETQVCTGPNHRPRDGAWLDQTRDDYVFVDNVSVALVGHEFLDFTYIGVASLGGTADSGEVYYVGSLLLEVWEDACGRFSMA